MSIKTGSIIALGIVLSGVLFLLHNKYIISKNPITITIQICSLVLMIWARITFGLRSFHASANTTQGKLVTTGPYHWLRHPIYASIIYFVWACVISNPFIDTIVAVVFITGGLYVRMVLEEKSLRVTYPEYLSYSDKVKRIIPFLF